jgi:hypothetical protein
MELKQALQEQAADCLDQITAVLQDLSDEQLAYRDPRLDERPIAAVAMHAAGTLPFFMGFVMAGGDQPRAGGPPPTPATTAELLSVLGGTREGVRAQIAALSEEQLDRRLTTPWGAEASGTNMILNGFTHAQRHVGTILDLRSLGGFPTHVLG